MLKIKITLILILFNFVQFVSADYLYTYDNVRCHKEIGLFEYSQLHIYNIDELPNELGYQKTSSSKYKCSLNGNILISITPKSISISHKGKEIFKGAKMLKQIRVFSDPSTIHTIELCSWNSEIHEKYGSAGGCLFRGFPAIIGSGPKTPLEAFRILHEL